MPIDFSSMFCVAATSSNRGSVNSSPGPPVLDP